MVAELLCTTMVMQRPSRMPRSGDSFTRVIHSRKTACPASGCSARPKMSMPSKSSPKENTASPTACQRPAGREVEEEAQKQHRVHQRLDIEGDELCRHGGADVDAVDDGHRPGQFQQPGADKADDHHRRRRAALEHCRHGQPGEDTQQRRGRQPGQQPFHGVTRRPLQGAAHPVHPVEEHRQPAEQRKEHLHPRSIRTPLVRQCMRVDGRYDRKASSLCDLSVSLSLDSSLPREVAAR